MIKEDFFLDEFYELEENGKFCSLEILDSMGTDDAIADAARISYNAGKGPRKSTTETLVYNLMKREHWTPFEQAVVKFRVKIPNTIWKQWLRHRLASINESSLRYSSNPEFEFFVPKVWRDARGLPLPDEVQTALTKNLEANHRTWVEVYRWRIGLGVAREQARIDAPGTLIADAYWTANLREVFHFATLRGDEAAQLEIRRYARRMVDLVAERFPCAAKAFREIRGGAR
ncbi:MAG: FAD-dependent thymidylate synthase [Thermoguttaceae bacterium]|nr:FAD-dependent thymidylate synthase [Thermoguttaceae bacterium]